MDPLSTLPGSSASARASSRSKITNHPRKSRSACNRCHTQKLRCVRNLGEVSCERCLKLHTSCRYGPRAPRASLKPPVAVASIEMPSEAASISMPNVNLNARITDEGDSEWLLSSGIDTDITEDQVAIQSDRCHSMRADGLNTHDLWSDSFCEPVVLNPLDQYSFPEVDPINQQTHAVFPSTDKDTNIRFDDHDTHDHREISSTSVIHQLANLIVAVYECSVNLPYMLEADLDTAKIASTRRGPQKAKFFAVDELFRLTSEFTNIIESLSSRTGSTLSSSDQITQTMLVMEHTSQSVSKPTEPSTCFSQIDEGTMLMIMSCHCRLTDTYLSIFQRMQACIEHSSVSQTDRDVVIILPRLQIGSHASSQVRVDANTALESGTAEMYMLLVTMLSSQLCNKLADVMRFAGGVPGGTGSAPRCLFMATITERMDHLRRTINSMKQLLQRFSLMPE